MSVTINKLISEAYDSYGMMQLPLEVESFTKWFKELNCKNIMEIGTYAGGLFSIMCKLSDSNGLKVSVDYPFYGTQETDENYLRFLKDVRSFSKNVVTVKGDSHAQDTLEKVREILNGKELDFLFIDGDHTYEGVKQDFEMYKEFVKDGGFIGFHDINDTEWHRSVNCHVAKFWDELPQEIKHTEFNTKSYGLGIGIVQVFKHKRKLDLNVWFEAPGTIHIANNSHTNLELLVSIREKVTKMPIYWCDMTFMYPGQSWYIQPIGGTNWLEEKYLNTFLLEFYDKNKNLIDTKELKIKDDVVKIESIGTRQYSAFDCLWMNYKQMFLDKIYDKFEIDNLGTVIDIGANVGIFSNYISNRNATTIHAIEPTQKAVDDLKKQFYYYNGVKIHKIGIGAENGAMTIYVNNDNSTISNFKTKTSDNITEEQVSVFTLPTFYANNNIQHVDLIKMDIESMEYQVMDSLSDEDVLLCSRYLIEYHLNQNNELDKLVSRLKLLGYSVDIYPDDGCNNLQGHFFAKLLPPTGIKGDTPAFPKRAYVTFTNEYYLPITERLVKSLQNNSKYPIIVYSINCDVNFSYPNMFTKRIDSDNINTPRFEAFDKVVSHKQGETVEVLSPENSFGIVDRNNINTYLTLSRKPIIILDAINNGVEEGIFLDADGIAKENIDSSFDYLTEVENYPLVGKGLYEYMMLNGLGDPATGRTLEQPLMDLIGVQNRTMYYVATNFILFTNKTKKFVDEWKTLADRQEIVQENIKYAPYHDETLMNVLLWKYGATKQLPRVHYNLTNAKKAEEFYTTDQRGVYTDSDWHYIPHDIHDIKFFHGCKSLQEIDKTIDLINTRKEKHEFNYHYKKLKFGDTNRIAIVTLFDSNYRDLANIAIPNISDYARKHGYDVVFFDETIDTTRPPQWSKIKAVEYVLNEYDWVWWLDIDALIANEDIKLESIIDEQYDLIFTANKYSVISNGSSFYRNSELTRKFLKECYTLDRDVLRNVDVFTFDHEQKPMRTLYQTVPEYSSRIKLVHERVCNSFWKTNNQSVLNSFPDWNTSDNIYQDGDFIVNFCGRDKNERIVEMNAFLNKTEEDPIFYTTVGEERLTKLKYFNNTMENLQVYGDGAAQYYATFIAKELDGPDVQINSGDVVVDLGANIGMSAAYAHSRGAKEIYCFEPDPNLVKLIYKNVPGVIIHQNAISHKNENVELYHWPYNPVHPGPMYSCECLTIRDVLKIVNKKINYLKVDIEGFEENAFDELTQRECSQIEKMMVEHHRPERLNEFIGKLQNKGFTITHINHGHQAFIYAKYTGNMVFSDDKVTNSFDVLTNTVNFSANTDFKHLLISIKDIDSGVTIWSATFGPTPRGNGGWVIPTPKMVIDYENTTDFGGISVEFYDEEQLITRNDFRLFHLTTERIKVDLKNNVHPIFNNYVEFFIDGIYDKHLKNKVFDTILDVGANVGLWTKYIEYVAKNKQIYLVEPNVDCLESLQKTFHFDTSKVIVPYALSNINGEMTLFTNTQNTLVSSLNSYGDLTDSYKVKTITFSALVDKYNISYIDLMKVDIEAAEYDLFTSMTTEDFSKVGNILIEYHLIAGKTYDDDVVPMVNKFKDVGYTVEITQLKPGLGYIFCSR